MVTREELVRIISQCSSQREVLAHFGLRNVGGNHTTLKSRAVAEDINLSELRKRAKKLKIRRMHQSLSTTPLAEILVRGSSYSRSHLKRRLLKEGLLGEKCAKCGQGYEWQGQPLVLVLDHINGVYDDNRLENLRLLCPNCNSQTRTFAGRKNRKPKTCKDCGCPIARGSARCRPCAARLRPTKIRWPSRDELLVLIEAHGYEGTGRLLGVTGTSVKNHAGV